MFMPVEKVPVKGGEGAGFRSGRPLGIVATVLAIVAHPRYVGAAGAIGF